MRAWENSGEPRIQEDNVKKTKAWKGGDLKMRKPKMQRPEKAEPQEMRKPKKRRPEKNGGLKKRRPEKAEAWKGGGLKRRRPEKSWNSELHPRYIDNQFSRTGTTSVHPTFIFLMQYSPSWFLDTSGPRPNCQQQSSIRNPPRFRSTTTWWLVRSWR